MFNVLEKLHLQIFFVNLDENAEDNIDAKEGKKHKTQQILEEEGDMFIEETAEVIIASEQKERTDRGAYGVSSDAEGIEEDDLEKNEVNEASEVYYLFPTKIRKIKKS
jgi:hypothetical protein